MCINRSRCLVTGGKPSFIVVEDHDHDHDGHGTTDLEENIGAQKKTCPDGDLHFCCVR